MKAGSINLSILSFARKVIDEPQRLIAGAFWLFYCWFLFLSDIAPGQNALSLDPGTWFEVRDLSLNFWLVLPSLFPQSAPSLHPILEATFNLVLAWSALFFGFLLDGRRKQSDTRNSFLPVVAGMQFLTNAFYLPYLLTRDVEKDSSPAELPKSLSKAEVIAESKLLPLLLLGVGLICINWGLNGRAEEFGDLPTRWQSYLSLAGSDRLTFSFLVDLFYYSIFQGWLIDADFSRRELSDSRQLSLKFVGKYIPFFGLVSYLIFRPQLLRR